MHRLMQTIRRAEMHRKPLYICFVSLTASTRCRIIGDWLKTLSVQQPQPKGMS